ncbi:MAG: PEP-CTERM sorting domain-containing protein [Planctomycetes bacterium]|nr:PEP-CTERM sorting domain-containing protein [Planctomycetota bacterium]
MQTRGMQVNVVSRTTTSSGVAAPLVPTPGPALNRSLNLVQHGSFEDDYSGYHGHDGIFGLDVTGYSTTYLACPDSAANSIFGTDNHTYRFEFAAPASSIEIKFTNWGHFFLNINGQIVPTTELFMDDVILNFVKIPEPATLGLIGLGGLVLLPRRRVGASAQVNVTKQ